VAAAQTTGIATLNRFCKHCGSSTEQPAVKLPRIEAIATKFANLRAKVETVAAEIPKKAQKKIEINKKAEKIDIKRLSRQRFRLSRDGFTQPTFWQRINRRAVAPEEVLMRPKIQREVFRQQQTIAEWVNKA